MERVLRSSRRKIGPTPTGPKGEKRPADVSAPPGRLAIEQKPEPFVMAEAVGFPVGGEFGEGLGHAMQAKGAELIEGGMFEQVVSPNCSSAAHRCWRAGSAFRPWRAGARDVGP